MRDDFREWEFRVVTGIDSEVQKILNQWRHDYQLSIMSVTIEDHSRPSLKVLLARKRIS